MWQRTEGNARSGSCGRHPRYPRAYGWLLLAVCTSLFFSCRGGQDLSKGRLTAEPIFQEFAGEVGLSFHHFTGGTGNYFLPEIMGAGVALLDYDSDGDLDIYVLQGTLLDPTKSLQDARFSPPKKHWPGNRLFRNELVTEGRLRFTDVTAQAGVGHQGYGMGAAVGDFDNDGDPDLYVTNFGSNVLYRNNGDGTFSDITRRANVDDARWSTSAAFVDYDGDGNLDLFVTNYVDFTIETNKKCYDPPTSARDYCTPTLFHPVPDRLFRNQGDGRFVDVSQRSGIRAAFGNGLGVTCADFSSDGWMDIYVANDGNANQLWLNRGDGTFEDVALLSGTAYNADGNAEAGMGVTAGDFDGDGDEDLFMTHLVEETNTLYLNDGSGNFHDATNRTGLGAGSVPYTGFGVQWFDYDNDGWLDLFVSNGAVTIEQSLLGSAYPFHQRNQLFRGLGNEGFEDVSGLAGPALELSEVSRGAAFADIDRDGDIDIVVSNNNGPLRLLLNQVGSRRHWLQLRLEGVHSNRDGLGARVAVVRYGHSPLWRRPPRAGSYLTASDVSVHFGLGDDSAIEGVGVLWPSGRREIWKNVRADAHAHFREGEGQYWPAEP